MRNPFFSRKNDAAATTCAAGFACSDVNTNSALLLTIVKSSSSSCVDVKFSQLIPLLIITASAF